MPQLEALDANSPISNVFRFEHSASEISHASMVVKIRLARFGKRNAPFYNIVVAQARYVAGCFIDSSDDHSISEQNCEKQQAHRGPRYLRLLIQAAKLSLQELYFTGTYDPIPKPPPLGEGKPYKDIKLDTARAKYWLGVGAQPSDPAWRLLSMVGTHCIARSSSCRDIG